MLKMSSSISSDREAVIMRIRSKPKSRAFLPSFTTVSLVAFFIISLLMNGDITPLIKRGFFCNDSSIKYPFKTDTISVKVLFLIALVIPGIVIKCCDRFQRKLIDGQPSRFFQMRPIEDDDPHQRKLPIDSEECDTDEDDGLINARRRILPNNSNRAESQSEVRSKATKFDENPNVGLSSKLGSVLRKTLGDFQLFLFGFCTTMMFTGLGKITCGRFRPHFLQRCQPDIDCSSYKDSGAYIEKFTCTNNQLTSRDMSYITTSWPSGHAAIMFFSMTYMIVYLNRTTTIISALRKSRQNPRWSPLSLFVLYVLMIGLAIYIAGTRVSDYHHHSLDVISGGLIGFAIALVLTKSIPMRTISYTN